MSSRKLLVLTGFVVALFAFIFFFERKLPTTAERGEKGELHWDLPEDRVESIRLVRAGDTVELAKTGDAWKLVRPEAYPADSFAASDLATSLADLKRPSGESGAAEGKPEDYGLAKPSASATFVWTDPDEPGAKKSRTVELGIDIPGTELTAAKVAGRPGILFVPSSVGASIRKSADEFKSKEVFGGGALDVTRLEVVRGRGGLVFGKKNGAWWIEQPIADLADRDAAERLTGDLATLRVTEFVAPPADRKSLGLDPPLFRITLTDAKNGKHALDVGSTRSEGDAVYASRQGQVFTLPGSSIEDLSKEAVAFRDRRLVRFERGDVHGIEATVGGRKFSFRREPAGWMAGGRTLLASAADDLISALLEAESAEFLDEAAARDLAARLPESSYEIRLSRGPAWKVALHPFRGELAATVSGRPGAFRVSRATGDRLRGAVEKAAASPGPTPTAKKP